MRIGVVSDTHDRLPTLRADVIVTGHSHRPVVDVRDGKLFVNPGECCGWVTGRATVAAIDLKTNDVELIEVDS